MHPAMNLRGRIQAIGAEQRRHRHAVAAREAVGGVVGGNDDRRAADGGPTGRAAADRRVDRRTDLPGRRRLGRRQRGNGDRARMGGRGIAGQRLRGDLRRRRRGIVGRRRERIGEGVAGEGIAPGSLNRVISDEQPESQIPTRPVSAKRTTFRRTNTAALLDIGLHTPTRLEHGCNLTRRVNAGFKMNISSAIESKTCA